MPRPKKPFALAVVTGATVKDPQRYRQRGPQDLPPLGDPPDWLPETDANRARSAWMEIAAEAPWLNNSHRGLTEIAALVRGKLIAGVDVGVQALGLLRLCLSSMGLTPGDAHKVQRSAAVEDDPAAKYFT